MKKTGSVFLLCMLFAFLGFKRNIERADQVRFKGFFYKYLPYDIKYEGENVSVKVLKDIANVVPGREGTFRVSMLKEGSAELLFLDSIRGKALKIEAEVRMPMISPLVAGDGVNFISGDVVSKSDLLLCKGLLCQLWNYDIDLNFSVNSFALLLQKEGSNIDTIYSNGPFFNKSQKDAIRAIQNSQVIVIDEIRANEPFRDSTGLLKVPAMSLFLQN
ncbi:MAG TPA: hypothetical protein PKC58_16255 [Ignavibacteria bacterium]|nr:hypothetical protein [Ignavibacteria bacterium]